MLSLSNPPTSLTPQPSRHSRHNIQTINQPTTHQDTNYTLTAAANLDLQPALFDTSSIDHDPSIPDSMQTEAWGGLPPFTPRMGGRISNHQRESSLSSLGSAGPASPFNQNTSNPQIAVTDSASDTLSDMQAHDPASQNNYYQFAKSMGAYNGYQNLDGMPEMAYPVTIPGPSGRPRQDRAGLLPAPELAATANRSQPPSVTSSIAGDSPATPTVNEADLPNKRRKGAFGNVPKLDRTMTDVYGDELYSPHFSITSTTSPAQPSQMAFANDNDVFHQRINAANTQHLNAGPSPNSAVPQDRSSPFRTGSPFNTSPNAFPNGRTEQPFNSAQKMREQATAQQQQEAQFMHSQSNAAREPETPKTISPKDAILEFNEPEGGANFPLFPTEPTTFEMDQFAKSMMPQDTNLQANLSGALGYTLNSQFPAGLQVPQQYPFIARPHASHDTPPRLSSAGSSSAGSVNGTPVSRPRPAGMAADGGTYTCTYHGCTLRFDTPALLQKHKREGHRQAQGLGATRPSEVSMTSSILNTQAGPHTCNRINPSTGKPCKTVFSRPYDLTRHEDTIHNARKQKVRCDLCTEEKTFSRADALTRHYRVCHPDVELPGKHRRRGGV